MLKIKIPFILVFLSFYSAIVSEDVEDGKLTLDDPGLKKAYDFAIKIHSGYKDQKKKKAEIVFVDGEKNEEDGKTIYKVSFNVIRFKKCPKNTTEEKYKNRCFGMEKCTTKVVVPDEGKTTLDKQQCIA